MRTAVQTVVESSGSFHTNTGVCASAGELVRAPSWREVRRTALAWGSGLASWVPGRAAPHRFPRDNRPYLNALLIGFARRGGSQRRLTAGDVASVRLMLARQEHRVRRGEMHTPRCDLEGTW